VTTVACVVCRIPRPLDALVTVGDVVLGRMRPYGQVVCRPGRGVLEPSGCWTTYGKRLASDAPPELDGRELVLGLDE